MQYRILPFSCNVFFMIPCCHWLYSLSCGFIWASAIQLNLVSASDALAVSVFQTTVSRMHAWRNALLRGIAAAFDVSNFRLAFLLMSLFLHHSDQQNKFLSIFWHVRLLVSRLPILVFLSFERLFQFFSKRQTVCDLDVMSFGFLSVSPRTTYILVAEFRSTKYILWNPSTNRTDFCFRRRSNSRQFVFLVLHPIRCELTWWHQYTSVERGTILLLARIIGLSVQYDGDKWNLLEYVQ